MNIRVAGIIEESVVDGPGIRLVVFTQGCCHNCQDCHNPETHDVNGGFEIEIDALVSKLTNNPLLSGITISGGEPLLQVDAVLELVSKIKKVCAPPPSTTVYLYTGFMWEELITFDKLPLLLNNVDVTIDGLYDKSKPTYGIGFKGSTNQRVIDVKRSLEAKSCILKA